MSWLIQNWETVLSWFFALCGFLAAVITFCKTRNIKKSVDTFKEVSNMQKPMSLEQAQKKRPAPTEFSEYKDDYVLNTATNELEKLPTQVNIQKKIDSYLECALDRVLDRLMPNVVDSTEEVQEQYQNSLQDLASLGDAMEVAEQWRDELQLPDNYSIAQIYDAVGKRSRELKSKLGEFEKKETESNEKKKTE